MANQYSFAQSNGGNNNANRLYLRTLSKISLFDVSQKIEKKIRSPPVWIPLADAGKSKSTSLFADLLTADWQPSLPNLYPDAESSDDDTPVRDNAAIYRDDMEEEEEEDVEPTAAAAAAEEPASLTQQVADFVSQKFGLTSAEGLKKVLCDLEEEAEKEQEEATTTRRLPMVVPAATEGEEVTASKDWPSHWIPVCATQAQMRWCDDAVNDANANADLYVCCEKSFDILNHPRFAFLDDDVNLATLGSQGSGKTFLLQKFLEKLSTAEKVTYFNRVREVFILIVPSWQCRLFLWPSWYMITIRKRFWCSLFAIWVILWRKFRQCLTRIGTGNLEWSYGPKRMQTSKWGG